MRQQLYERYKTTCRVIDAEILQKLAPLFKKQTQTALYLCVDPVIANFPFEGLPTLEKYSVKRVVQSITNSKGRLMIRKSTAVERFRDGLVVVGENEDLNQTYNTIQKILSKRAE